MKCTYCWSQMEPILKMSGGWWECKDKDCAAYWDEPHTEPMTHEQWLEELRKARDPEDA